MVLYSAVFSARFNLWYCFNYPTEDLYMPAKKMSRKPAKRTKAKAAPRKSAAKPKKAAGSVNAPYTKSQLYTEIATLTEVPKRDVAAVFDALTQIIEQHISKKGVQLFKLPGLLKVKVIRKPATKARRGINPFTKEEVMFKAKPARNVVKVQALKALKEMVQ
jgi:nucleoid DNA-binding protein